MLGSPTRQSGLPLIQQGFSNWWHLSAWLVLVLVFLAFGLLWAFHQVTRNIVQQSELRLQIASEYNKATWHCNSLSGQLARKNCLSQRTLIASTVPARQP
jgi:nitrate/nitrite transporter NarK